MLDVDVHGDEGDDEDGAGRQVDGDDVVGQLPLEGHHKDGGLLVVGSGGHLDHDDEDEDNYDEGGDDYGDEYADGDDDDEDDDFGNIDLGDGELGQVGHPAVDQCQGPQLNPLAGTKLVGWSKVFFLLSDLGSFKLWKKRKKTNC